MGSKNSIDYLISVLAATSFAVYALDLLFSVTITFSGALFLTSPLIITSAVITQIFIDFSNNLERNIENMIPSIQSFFSTIHRLHLF